jgi:hypothetical protein
MQIHLPPTLQEQLALLESQKIRRPSQATLITNHVKDNIFNHVRTEFNNRQK